MGCMILIEGLDLAGKSTLLSSLQRHFLSLGWQVRVAHGDLCPENPVAQVARQMMRWDPGFSSDEGGPLFLASHLWDLRNFCAPQEARCLHIQDSSALRSLAFERVFGRPALLPLFEDVVDRLPTFDLTVGLTAGLETRKRRYQQRAENDLNDQFLFRNPEGFSRVDEELMALVRERLGGQVLTTDELAPRQVFELVLQRAIAATTAAVT